MFVTGLILALSTSNAFAQDSISCEGGVALDAGTFFMDSIPSGCSAFHNFIAIKNGVPGSCMSPAIGELDSSAISVTNSVGNIKAYGVVTNPGKPNEAFVPCVPFKHTVYGFVPDADMVQIGVVGYTVPDGTIDRPREPGDPLVILNGLSPSTGLTNSRQMADATWTPKPYNLSSAASSGSTSATTGLRTFTFDATRPHF